MIRLQAYEYKTDYSPVWCPGCGDFAALNAIYGAVSRLSIPPQKLTIVAGIGCSGRLPAFIKCNGLRMAHGRTLPAAMGVKLVNPDQTVFAVSGDGDGFAIGGGHVPHAARRNIDITYLVFDNQVYGLTKGQPSPTSRHGQRTKASPFGVVEEPLNIIALTLSYGATFVARGFSGRAAQLTDLILKGTEHRGFALIQILTPCITLFDTWKAYRERVVEIESDHDPRDYSAALKLAAETDRLPIGLFYRCGRPTFEDGIEAVRAKAEEAFEAKMPLEAIFERYRVT